MKTVLKYFILVFSKQNIRQDRGWKVYKKYCQIFVSVASGIQGNTKSTMFSKRYLRMNEPFRITLNVWITNLMQSQKLYNYCFDCT